MQQPCCPQMQEWKYERSVASQLARHESRGRQCAKGRAQKGEALGWALPGDSAVISKCDLFDC